jgi:hypothetical protein
VTPYYPRNDLHPFALLFAFEYLLDCLKNQGVVSLNCSVGLRVLYRCEGDLCPDLVIEILEHDTIKILGVVNSDLPRDSIATNDILPKKSLDGGGGYVGYRLLFNPFGEVFHCDDGKSVISLCWCNFAHDIDAPPLQGPGWGYQL